MHWLRLWVAVLARLQRDSALSCFLGWPRRPLRLARGRTELREFDACSSLVRTSLEGQDETVGRGHRPDIYVALRTELAAVVEAALQAIRKVIIRAGFEYLRVDGRQRVIGQRTDPELLEAGYQLGAAHFVAQEWDLG